MNRRVQRRQKHISTAVTKAIDVAIERFWVSSGIGSDGRKHLKQRGRERDADVVVIVGRPTFGNVKGKAPAPAKAFVKALSQRFRTLVIDEFRTSKLCDACGAKLIKTRGHSVRFWRCPHDGERCKNHDDGKKRHVSEQNKVIVTTTTINNKNELNIRVFRMLLLLEAC